MVETKNTLKDLAYIHAGIEDQHHKFRKKTILITGCAGFLGYYVMKYLSTYLDELEIKEIIGLDNFIVGEPEWVKDLNSNKSINIYSFNIVDGDLENINNIAKVDYVIHMASIASPIYYRKYPLATIDANVWGLRKLLDYYLNKNLEGFLFFSSSETYGDPDPQNIPTQEDYRGLVSFTGPRACYDEAKRFGETLCGAFAREHNFQVSIARPFNNYGPGMKRNDMRAPPDFANAILERRDIDLFSNGSPTRTFCYITDAIIGYFKVLFYNKFDAFNIGLNSSEISILGLAEIFRDVAFSEYNYSCEINYKKSDDSEYLIDNPNRRCPDISKAKQILNYNPKIDIETGVLNFLRFVHENPRDF